MAQASSLALAAANSPGERTGGLELRLRQGLGIGLLLAARVAAGDGKAAPAVA